jgi:Spy/CpxP family protein refolding chaperone
MFNQQYVNERSTMKKSIAIVALALSVSAWSATAQGGGKQASAGERQSSQSGEANEPGDRGLGAGVPMLPPRAAEELKLTDKQKKQLAELREQTKAKFEKILTKEQVEKLQKMRSQREQAGRGMGGPAMRGRGMGRPGMAGSGMGGRGMQGPGMRRGGTGGPGMWGRGMGGSGMGRPDMEGPGMGQPGMGAPGMQGRGMGRFGMGPQAWGRPFRGGQDFNGPRHFRGPGPDGGADNDAKPEPKAGKE